MRASARPQLLPRLDQPGSPPRGGLPLGTVLGVAISLVVAVSLGGLTFHQLRREERRERSAREQLLAESLAPLAAAVEAAADLDEVRQLLVEAEQAEVEHGRPDYNLVLTDGAGRIVLTTAAAGDSPPRGLLQARLSVRTELLPSGHGTLAAWQGASELVEELASRRRAAWIDIAATVLIAAVVVQLVIHLLVTRPLRRLIATIDKVEQGYPAALRQGDVARELRWLEWHFARMSATLANGARLLVAAHRRAMEASRSRVARDVDPRFFDPLAADRDGTRSAGRELVLQYLRARCVQLESLPARDPRALETARQAWESDAVEAERLGEVDLRVRIENAALTILEPDTFERIGHDLAELVAARAGWLEATARAISAALAADGVEVAAIQHRAKHTAGVWRKMQEKRLALDEVHDILAFRVIVAGHDDCYLALDTIHRLFEPEPFRFKDYIAAPKPNGYRSLHTSVSDRDGLVFEVQIRTAEMHRAAENGDSAHWRYHADRTSQARVHGAAGRRRRPRAPRPPAISR